MNHDRYSMLVEAKELLQEVQSWSEEELANLPPLYQRKARDYRQLPQSGED